jgi:thioredoxin-like negative regulator of GroEL
VAALGQRSTLAQHLLEQGFFTEGEALLREAIAEEPADGLAPVLLTVVLVATGRAEEAAKVRAATLARAEDDAARRSLEEQFDAAERQALEVQRAQHGQGAAPEAPPTLEAGQPAVPEAAPTDSEPPAPAAPAPADGP